MNVLNVSGKFWFYFYFLTTYIKVAEQSLRLKEFIGIKTYCFFTTGSRMSVTVVMTDWAVFHPQNMGQEIQAFVKMIQQAGRDQNFNVPEPK